MLYIYFSDSPLRMVGKTIVIVQWWLKRYLIDDVIDFVNDSGRLSLICEFSLITSLLSDLVIIIITVENQGGGDCNIRRNVLWGQSAFIAGFWCIQHPRSSGEKKERKTLAETKTKEKSFWNHSIKKWLGITSPFILNDTMFHSISGCFFFHLDTFIAK